MRISLYARAKAEGLKMQAACYHLKRGRWQTAKRVDGVVYVDHNEPWPTPMPSGRPRGKKGAKGLGKAQDGRAEIRSKKASRKTAKLIP